MSQKNIDYMLDQIKQAKQSGDEEAVFELQHELAMERAHLRLEETGRF